MNEVFKDTDYLLFARKYWYPFFLKKTNTKCFIQYKQSKLEICIQGSKYLGIYLIFNIM